MQRALVLHNQTAGRGLAEAAVPLTLTALRGAGLAVEEHRTRFAGDGGQVARERGGEFDRILVVGGDGTLREVAEGLLLGGHGAALGMVPTGNANVVAREFGVPLHPVQAAAAQVDARPHPIDVAYVGERLVLAMVGVGYDGRVVQWVHGARRRPVLRTWYRLHADSLYGLLGGAALLDLSAPGFRVEVDGEPLPGTFHHAVLSNLRCYAKGWAVSPAARPDDGLLDVHARPARGPIGTTRALVSALRQRPASPRVASAAQGRRVRLHADGRPFLWQADGDPMGATHDLELEVRPRALRFLVPADAAARGASVPLA